LHAGLIPALQQGKVEGSEQWVIATMVPGSHPLDELETALVRSCAKPGIEIMAQLLRDERGLQRLAGMFLSENKQLLLVIDQFEELFRQQLMKPGRRFLALIGSTVADPHSRVRVVMALRADYYDRPLMSPAIELFRLRTERDTISRRAGSGDMPTPPGGKYRSDRDWCTLVDESVAQAFTSCNIRSPSCSIVGRMGQ
jgi:hypothetical protein